MKKVYHLISTIVLIALACTYPIKSSAQSEWTVPSVWEKIAYDSTKNPVAFDTLVVEGFDEREISLIKYSVTSGDHDFFYPQDDGIEGASDTKALRIYPGSKLEIHIADSIFDPYCESWQIAIPFAAHNVNKKDTLTCVVKNKVGNYSKTDALLIPPRNNYSVSFTEKKNKRNGIFVSSLVHTYDVTLKVYKGSTSSSNGYYCFDNISLRMKLPPYTKLKQSGEWNNPKSWSHYIPGKRRNALIDGEVTINTRAECNELIVCRPDIRISGLGELTANKVTVVYPFEEKGKWYFVSFPFDVYRNGIDNRFKLGDASTVTSQENNNILYIMRYDGQKRSAEKNSSECNWTCIDIHNITEETPVIRKGEGYLIAIDKAADIQELCFSSQEGSKQNYVAKATINVKADDAQGERDEDNGWVLCGNPLPSTLSLQDIEQNADTDGYIYIYDGNKYKQYVIGDAYKLAPFESFFIKAKRNTTLTINPTTHPEDELLRSSYLSHFRTTKGPQITGNEKRSDKTTYSLAKGLIELYDVKSNGTVTIYNILGEKLMHAAITAGHNSIRLPKWNGIYIIRLETPEWKETIKYKP